MDHLKHLDVVPGSIDSHCHVTIVAGRGVPLDDVLARCFGGGMRAILDVAITAADIDARVQTTRSFPAVFHSVGVHPSEAGRVTAADAESAIRRAAAAHRSVIALGETGLDWYRNRDYANSQHELFELQVQLARELELPLIIHNRDATEDILSVLRRQLPPRGGVMHCFSAASEYVDAFVDLGFCISFAGNVSFPGAHELRLAAARVPDHALLAETDAPFLAPVPARGRPNHPGYVAHVYRILARTRRQSLDQLTETISTNFARLFPRYPAAGFTRSVVG